MKAELLRAGVGIVRGLWEAGRHQWEWKQPEEGRLVQGAPRRGMCLERLPGVPGTEVSAEDTRVSKGVASLYLRGLGSGNPDSPTTTICAAINWEWFLCFKRLKDHMQWKT